jgi:putative transposase
MCRVLEVGPAGYYASLKRPSSWHALIDELLLARVRVIHEASGETYGAPRIQRELQEEGLPTSVKRVARLMQAEDLSARPRKRYRVATTDSDHTDPIAPNLLARQFAIQGVGVNQVWGGRHHVHPDARGHALPRHRARPRLSTVRGLGDGRHRGW